MPTISDALSVMSAWVKTKSQEISAVSVGYYSVDSRVDVLSIAISVISQAVSVVSQQISVLSNKVSALQSGISARSVGGVSTRGMQSIVDALSNRISGGVAGSATSAEVQTASAAATSVDARATSLANAVSVLSQQISVLSQQVSILSQAQSVLSDKVVSVSAQIVSVDAHAAAASAAATSVDGRATSLAQAVSVISQTLSTVVSGASARSVGDVSTHGFQSILNALSNRISAGTGGSASPTSNQFSIISQQVSVLSQAHSVVSQALSSLSDKVVSISAQIVSVEAHVAAASAAATSVDARLNSVLSTVLSATGQVVPQIRSRGNVVSVISAGTLVNIASLSVSVAGGDAIYKIDGAVAFEKATSGGCAFGISVPALGAGGSYLYMAVEVLNQQAGAIGAAATYSWGRVALSAVAAMNTAVVSASVLATNAIRFMHFEGMLAVSTAGTVQIMGKGSVAGDSMSVRGGYIRAYRLA